MNTGILGNSNTPGLQGDNIVPKSRDRAFSYMNYSDYIKSYGIPPAPLVKPQVPPNDMLGDMELPPGELPDKPEKITLACPHGLNRIQEEVDSDEEGDGLGTFSKPEEKKVLDKIPIKTGLRFRSQSENITSCSIFKFMENVPVSTNKEKFYL